MGFKIRKRVKIAPGVHLNVGKKGISTSVKVGKVTCNSKGKITTNLGNGISYEMNTKGQKKNNNQIQNNVDDLISPNENYIDGLTKEERELMFNEEVMQLQRGFNSWSNLSDRQIKIYNCFIKCMLGILALTTAFLSVAIPIAIPVAIVFTIGIFIFDAGKLKQKEQRGIDKKINELKELYEIE